MQKSLLLGALFFFAFARAMPTDPDCLNIPNERPVKAWQIEGLAELLGEAPPKNEVTPLNQATLFAAGFRYSDLIYLAPDLEMSPSPDAFIRDFENFYAKIPHTHELYHIMSDPQSGLKYAILKPKAGEDFRAWILTIAGTQTLLDKIVDGLMGRAQMDRLATLFTKCLFQDSTGKAVFDIPLIFLGHSLGGGLAEALYHQIQGKLRLLRKPGFTSPLNLVTMNAFGGRGALDQINVPFFPEYVEPDHIANYYVRGDVVSSVGTHIGPSYELIPVDPTGNEVKLNWGGAHALATFFEIARVSAALGWQMPNVPKAPKQSFTINKFYQSQKDGKLGFALFLYPKVNYLFRSNNGSIADFIVQTTQRVVQNGVKTPVQYALLKYLQVLAADEELRLRQRPSLTGAVHARADQLKAAMDDAQNSFDNLPGELLQWLMRRNQSR